MSTTLSNNQHHLSTCVKKKYPWHLQEHHQSETFPRAWRKRRWDNNQLAFWRNISTCAEKTQRKCLYLKQKWKHLHVRGENTTESGLFALYMRHIESFRAIFVKEQNILLAFILSDICFISRSTKKTKIKNIWMDTITQQCISFRDRNSP